jgi:protein-S-isoprenylcysteine O-methyltransferase Ste14
MDLQHISYYTNIASFVIVVALWGVLAWTLIRSRKPGSAPHAAHERRSWVGFALQILSFPIIGDGARHPMFSPLIDEQFALNIVLQLIAIALIVGSALFEISAFRELGKQWSLQARVLEGHQLVKTGAYSIVRHPIYTALLARLLATGLTMSHWITITIAVVVYIIGTKIRTVSEERLLREAFGDEFDSWKKRVPALIPFTKI